jgi:uncharacterized protein DUF3223
MPKKIIIIGERVYPSKTEALAAVREVRDRVRDTGSVSEADDEFIRDLLALHPRASENVGVGVDHFEVRDNIGTEGFWIIRSDGSATEFSFMKCLNGATHESLVRSAMRGAVIDANAECPDAALRARLRTAMSRDRRRDNRAELPHGSRRAHIRGDGRRLRRVGRPL